MCDALGVTERPTCPWCGVLAGFNLRQSIDAVVTDDAGGSKTIKYGIWTCHSCNRPIVGEAVDTPTEGLQPFGERYPEKVSRPDYPATVPPPVAADAREAHACFSIKSWRASVAMARRSLQAAAIEQGAPDKKLVAQVDWLEEQRLIPPLMKDVAHRIRLEGNVGAHPDKDGLQDIDEARAREVLDFLDDFIRYVYEIPSRLQAITEPPQA